MQLFRFLADLSTAGGLLLLILFVFLGSAIKIVQEYERGVIFRLGAAWSEPKARVCFSSSPSLTA